MSRRSLRCAAVALLLASVAALGAPAAADPRKELEATRARLRELETRITSQQDRVQGLASELGRLVETLGQQEQDFAAIRRELRQTEARLLAQQGERAALQQRLRARARDVYKRGPTPFLHIVLRSGSMSELGTVAGYASRALGRDARLIESLETVEGALQDQVAAHAELLGVESASLRSLRAEHRTLARAFEDQQRALEELSRARTEAQALIASLRGRIRASELSGLERAAGRGTPISFGEWAGHFLRHMGAPVTRSNQVVVVAWQAAEYTKATWNPLATSYHMPGATVFNSHGVRNYVSLEQGVHASVATLRRPNRGYEPVVAAFMAGNDAMATARAINASMWCRGCNNGNYLVGLIPTVEAYYDRYASR
ncbi:MAG TPA: hypothetical protein VM840_01195 [Actinomycetota bacterium]|nr:hypothetical protein [Actinomycetota bacterium]